MAGSSILEQVSELDITGNEFSDDVAFRNRCRDSWGLEVACVCGLKDALPSKSGQQAVIATLVCPLSARGDDSFLISDLHGTTARLAVGAGAARHHLLQSLRSKGGGGSSGSSSAGPGTVVLLIKPVTIYDPISKNAQLYLDSQTQLVRVGRARFFGACGAKTKAGGQCKVVVDTNRDQHCVFHCQTLSYVPDGGGKVQQLQRLQPAPSAAQLEHGRLQNQAGLQTLFGGVDAGSSSNSSRKTAPDGEDLASIGTANPPGRPLVGSGSSQYGSSTSRGSIPLTRKHLPTAVNSLALSMRIGQANGISSDGVGGGLGAAAAIAAVKGGKVGTSSNGSASSNSFAELAAGAAGVAKAAAAAGGAAAAGRVENALRAADAFHRQREARIVLADATTGAGSAQKLDQAGFKRFEIAQSTATPPAVTAVAAVAPPRAVDDDPLAALLNPAASGKSQGQKAPVASSVPPVVASARTVRRGEGYASLDVAGDDDGRADTDESGVWDGFGVAARQAAARTDIVHVPEEAHSVFDRCAAQYRARQVGGAPAAITTAHGIVMPGAAAKVLSAGQGEDEAERATALLKAQQAHRQRTQQAVGSAGARSFPPPPPITALSRALHSSSSSASSAAAAIVRIPASASVSAKPIMNAHVLTSSTAAASGSVSAGRYAMAGGVLVDVSNLNSNAAAVRCQAKGAPTLSAENAAKAAAAKRKASSLDAEIEHLLSRKSSHASEADDAWFDEATGRMDKMAKQEYAQKKNNETTFVNITANQCLDCNFCTEDQPTVCRRKAHRVVSKRTVKRFWECAHARCGKRENTLDANCRTVKDRCSACGSYQWVPCGSQGSGRAFESRAGDRLVTAAADWTSRSDKDSMAEKLANL